MKTLTQECIDILHDFYHELFEGGIIDRASLSMFLSELEIDANGEED